MIKKSDQRTKQRRPAHIIAEYHVKEGVFRDIIKNIGPNGIFISTNRQIASNQQVEVIFPLFTFQHNIRVIGKVVRSGPNGFAISFDQTIAGIIDKNGQESEIVHEAERSNKPES